MSVRALTTIAVVTLSWLGAVSLSVAQDVEDSARHVGERGHFLVGYETQGRGNRVVEIYSPARHDPGAEPTLAAVRSLRTSSGREQAIWIDSLSCSSLPNVAQSLADLDMPQLRLQLGMPAGPAPASPRFDGPNYVVWGRAQQSDGAFAEVRLSANAGELAERIGAADDALRPCWADAAASGPSRQ